MKNMVAACRLMLASVLVATVGLPAWAADYSVKLFDRPGAVSTQPWDINDAGVIVGSADLGSGQRSGFVYQGGVFTDVAGPAGAAYTEFTGISNSGLVVGYYSVPVVGLVPSVSQHSFLYDRGTYTSFAVPGASDTVLRHISSDGRYLTGTYTIDESDYGFAYDRLTDAFATFGARSIAQGANIDGIVVGSVRPVDSPSTGFEYDFATDITSYPMIDGLERTRFRDINDVGTIAGFSASGPYLGFLLSDAGELTTFSIAGAYDTAGYGLNNHDVLVGWYTDFEGVITRGFVATPVPEPQSWALMLFGVAVIGWRRRTIVR